MSETKVLLEFTISLFRGLVKKSEQTHLCAEVLHLHICKLLYPQQIL